MRYRSYYRGYNLTPIWVLIGINFLFYIATIIRPDVITLLGLKPAIFSSEPWTIVTSMFVHAGFFHLFVNMLGTFFLGTYLVRLVGEAKFLIVYFLGGILGSVFFILLGNPYAIAVGASGAVYAVGGALAIMRPRLKVFIFPIPLPIDLWIAIILFMAVSFAPRIAWEAHLGGIVLGLIAGYIFRRRERRSVW